MWTAVSGAVYPEQGEIFSTLWGDVLSLTSLIVSMIVNALATGLIVFRIFKVFCQAKNNTTSDEQSLGFTGGRKLRSVIFVIIESGMALLVIQLTRVVLVIIDVSSPNDNPANWLDAYDLIIPIHEMLNVIASSIMAILCFTDSMDLARV